MCAYVFRECDWFCCQDTKQLSKVTIMDQFAAYRSALNIWKSIPPVLLVCGTVGNILTIVVLMRGKGRNSSTGMYLTALAISDLLVLWTGLLRQWINYTFDIDIRKLSENGCKFHVFLVYFGTQCSSWILVAVTSERFIGVWLPHKVKRGCTPRIAGIVIAVIVVCLMLLNVHWFYGMGNVSIAFGNETAHFSCYPVYDHYMDFIGFKWPWVDLCVFCLVPFTILMTGNISIIIRVLISKHKTRKQIAPNGRATNTKNPDKTSQLTAMLMTLNIVFLICVTPISIYLIGEPYWLTESTTAAEYSLFVLWWAIVNIFMYLNNTINFVLYFLSGSRFRQEVKALLCGGTARSIFETLNATTTRVAPSATPMRSAVSTSVTHCDMSSRIFKISNNETQNTAQSSA